MPINYSKLKTNDATYYGRKLDAVVDALKASTLTPGRGYKLRQSPIGTTLDISPSQGGGLSYPFDLMVSKGDDGINVRVRPGSVNQLLPGNYDASFAVSDSDLIYIKVQALTDGKKVTSCSLVVNEDEPDPQVPTEFTLPTSVDVLIGIIVSSVPYRMIGLGSIQLYGAEEFREDKSPAAGPGLSYVPFMAWKVDII